MIERLIKYVKIVYKWMTGVTIELLYPFITFSTSAIICFFFYLIIVAKK
jgi:hypothetical protein